MRPSVNAAVSLWRKAVYGSAAVGLGVDDEQRALLDAYIEGAIDIEEVIQFIRDRIIPLDGDAK